MFFAQYQRDRVYGEYFYLVGHDGHTDLVIHDEYKMH